MLVLQMRIRRNVGQFRVDVATLQMGTDRM